jgi:hypothetical protein
MPMQRSIANLPKKETAPYGYRLDGTPKGAGWLGPITHSNGATLTELAMGVSIDGKEILIPSIVPTLTKDEIKVLQNLPKGQRTPDSIAQKAIQHAIERIKQGKSPFKD